MRTIILTRKQLVDQNNNTSNDAASEREPVYITHRSFPITELNSCANNNAGGGGDALIFSTVQAKSVRSVNSQ